MTLSKNDVKLIQKTISESNKKDREYELQEIIKYILAAAFGFVAAMMIGAF